MHKNSDRRKWQRIASVGFLVLIALSISVSLTIAGPHSTGASSRSSSSEATVSLQAPEWPFQGIIEPASGRFWDTAHMRYHDVGGESRLGECFENYVVLDDSSVALGYTAYGARPRSKHYVIPWGDIAYPTINSGVAMRDELLPRRATFEAMRQNRTTAVNGLEASVTKAVWRGSAADGGDSRYVVGFQIANSLESRWYRPLGNGNGFVEHRSSDVTAEELVSVLRQSSYPDLPWHFSDVFLTGSDGRYYGITLYLIGHASCRDIAHTFVVDGTSGAIVACHRAELIQSVTPLVFFAANEDRQLTMFELPNAPSPIDLDDCPARIDHDPLSFFSAVLGDSLEVATNDENTRD
ncbi:MAG: hypothetical protein OXG25_09070 [Gammaproteobacteria bacterium]|nr:hypothetical protein [Gammaproteobacteria bacterium]